MPRKDPAKKSTKKPDKGSRGTSWGPVAAWYDTLLEKNDDTYQAKVILPNLVRAMNIKKGEKVLDLACGQGFFTRVFHHAGASVAGVDVARDLIAFAKKQSPREINFFVRDASDLAVFRDNYFDKIVIVLAVQNMEAPHLVFKECRRILNAQGKIYLVLNHPAFRIPRASSWGFDDTSMTQYRRIDRYLSESKAVIDMNPSKPGTSTTLSFHRPLQYYFKTLANAGFSVARLEEWCSHRKSESGPRQAAEDRARREIPLFLFLEVVK